MNARETFAAVAIAASAAAARADVTFGDFENGTASGFGYLTGGADGVQPWVAPTAGTVITAPSGPLAGSKVLELTGTADSFNFGLSQGAALAFDFLAQNLRSA